MATKFILRAYCTCLVHNTRWKAIAPGLQKRTFASLFSQRKTQSFFALSPQQRPASKQKFVIYPSNL